MIAFALQQVPTQPVPGEKPPPMPGPGRLPEPVGDPVEDPPPPIEDPDVVDPTPGPEITPPMVARDRAIAWEARDFDPVCEQGTRIGPWRSS